MLERFSRESCPMNRKNTQFIAFAEKFGRYAIDAANEKRYEEANYYAARFECTLKNLCEMNSIDYVVIVFRDSYPRIKLDDQFADFTKYCYYFAPPFSSWAEMTFFSERRKNITDWWQHYHYPLSCLVTYYSGD